MQMGEETAKFSPKGIPRKKADSFFFECDMIIEPDEAVLEKMFPVSKFKSIHPVHPMW